MKPISSHMLANTVYAGHHSAQQIIIPSNYLFLLPPFTIHFYCYTYYTVPEACTSYGALP